VSPPLYTSEVWVGSCDLCRRLAPRVPGGFASRWAAVVGLQERGWDVDATHVWCPECQLTTALLGAS
jgi:hypothetical protein